MKKITFDVPDTLKTVGWIYLAFGIIGAIVIFSTMGTMPGRYNSGPNPVGIALGVVSLFQGVVVCVLFQGIGLIAGMQIKIGHTLVTISDNLLADIRNNTAQITNMLANVPKKHIQTPEKNTVNVFTLDREILSESMIRAGTEITNEITTALQAYRSIKILDMDDVPSEKFDAAYSNLKQPIHLSKVAEIIGIADFQVIDLIKMGKLPGNRCDGEWYVDVQPLINLLD